MPVLARSQGSRKGRGSQADCEAIGRSKRQASICKPEITDSCGPRAAKCYLRSWPPGPATEFPTLRHSSGRVADLRFPSEAAEPPSCPPDGPPTEFSSSPPPLVSSCVVALLPRPYPCDPCNPWSPGSSLCPLCLRGSVLPAVGGTGQELGVGNSEWAAENGRRVQGFGGGSSPRNRRAASMNSRACAMISWTSSGSRELPVA